MAEPCEHFSLANDVTPASSGCRSCLELGDTWVHLRLCLVCGHVGCCDSSRNRHASRHFHATGHPVMRSFEAGETWAWCYLDELFVKRLPGEGLTDGPGEGRS